ncbi:hypothetical protein [Ferroplasma sp.]|uniref:hypothetical protein n=1 Tax=Ferroplasma sp. TaxID=2591003 RepID=UPI00261B98EB|nr:hypothetical protein [Ferroplasma sp.]
MGWRKNFLKFTGVVLLYALVMATIYFMFKHYTSESDANTVLGVMVLAALLPNIVHFSERYIKNKTAKKINK